MEMKTLGIQPTYGYLLPVNSLKENWISPVYWRHFLFNSHISVTLWNLIITIQLVIFKSLQRHSRLKVKVNNRITDLF